MNWISENRHWLLFAATVLAGLSTVGVAIVGVIATVSVLVTGGSLVLTTGGFVLATLLLGGLTLVSAAALLSTLAGRVSLPRSERAAAVLRGLEQAVPPLARLGLADRVEPSVEENRAALTARYVAGDLSERELEAELGRLLDEDEQRVPEAESLPDYEPDRERERER